MKASKIRNILCDLNGLFENEYEGNGTYDEEKTKIYPFNFTYDIECSEEVEEVITKWVKFISREVEGIYKVEWESNEDNDGYTFYFSNTLKFIDLGKIFKQKYFKFVEFEDWCAAEKKARLEKFEREGGKIQRPRKAVSISADAGSGISGISLN